MIQEDDRRFRAAIDPGGTFTGHVAGRRRLRCDARNKSPARRRIRRWTGARRCRQILDRHGCRRRPMWRGLSLAPTVATHADAAGRSTVSVCRDRRFSPSFMEIARQAGAEGYGNSYFWVKPARIVPAAIRSRSGRPLDFRGKGNAAARCGRRPPSRTISSATTILGRSGSAHPFYADPAHERSSW